MRVMLRRSSSPRRNGISNVSAYRVLTELFTSGHFWRAANGRYFLAEARRLLEKPAPVACLFRRLERWTEVGREMMQGVDAGCGELDRAILLVHDQFLFRQTEPTGPASIGADRELHGAIEDFLLVHSERIGGVVLDELWPDRVLAGFQTRLRSGVVIYRRTKLPFLGSVSADVTGAASLVMDHARRQGFDRLALLMPAYAYQPSEEMAAALRLAARRHFPKPQVFTMDSEGARRKLIADLKRQRRRTLLVVTEDNAATEALEAMRKAGIDVPGWIGLLSTMGSRIASDRSITIAGFDFRKMGEQAARMAVSGDLRRVTLPPTFISGATS